MGTTTFTGPVRSEGGFQVVSKNATTGAYTDIATIASTGIVTDKYVKHVGFATGVTVNSTAGDSPAIGEFTQPANTIITNIKIPKPRNKKKIWISPFIKESMNKDFLYFENKKYKYLRMKKKIDSKLFYNKFIYNLHEKLFEKYL